jgi:hypothetical protein
MRMPWIRVCYVEEMRFYMYIRMYECRKTFVLFCAGAAAGASANAGVWTELFASSSTNWPLYVNLYMRRYNTASRWKYTTLLSLRLAFALARVQQLALALAALDFALVPLAVTLGTVAHEPAM